MGIKDQLRRLERACRAELITIPQTDGTSKRFPPSALEEAFLRNVAFLSARANGETPPEPHPLRLALQNAARREDWHDTFFDMLEDDGPVEDLSEP